LLTLMGWDWQWHYDSRRSRPGYPDLTCWHPEKGLFFAELKSEKGRLSAEQKERIAGLRMAGQRAYVWRPSDWQHVQDVICTSRWPNTSENNGG
jgi:hypothetical protein